MSKTLEHSSPRNGSTTDERQPVQAGKHTLLASEARYRLLVDNQTDLVVSLDRDGRFQFVSPSYCEKFSCSESELRGTMFNQQILSRDLDQVKVAWQDLFTDPWTSQFEHRAQTEKGHRWLGWALKALRDDEQNVVEIVGVGRDVTDRHNNEEQARVNLNTLAHAGRIQSMGEMATTLAHELNQPLTAILSFSQASQRVLNEQDLDRDELAFALERIAVNAQLAGEIIGQMRSFIRKDKPRVEQSNINTLVTEALELVASELQHHEIDVDFNLTEAIPDVRVDPVQIQQVILNLVRNSMEAMQAQPADQRRLLIATRICKPGSIEVTVIDSGPGLDSTIAEQLFEAFVTTKPEGMGVGLSICKSLVESHGGRLSAQQSSEGGAVFNFILPSITEGDES